MKVKNPLALSGQFESTEDFNSSFLRTKMKVFYFGNNRNGSAFNTASFANARKSLSMIPIVAKYNSDTDNLEGHNVELTVDENGGYKLHHDTVPFGVVSSDSNITFEEVNDGSETNPDIKTYVVIDNVYLWKRYDATKRIESWIAEGIVPKISMEIGNVEGRFDEKGYFQISNFEFEAITALGSDIEPCFPRAEIETYSKQSFKDEFKSMVYELSEVLSVNQEGGFKEMEKEIPAAQATDAQFAEATEMNLLFDSANSTVDETTDDTNIDSDNLENSDETFEVTVESNSDSTPIDTESTENSSEVVDETVVETEADEVEPVDYESKFNTLSVEHSSLQSDFAALQTQLDELNTYKRQREESDIKAKFEGKLSDEEFIQVFTELKDSELDKVEEKLFALIGKKNFSIQSAQKSNVNKVVFSVREEETRKPYGGLIEKYSK